MLTLVARHVRGLGFSVMEASDGDTAWELAREHGPDLVILDVMMPGMSGWEICKRLKSQFTGTGVIMLTGIGENLNEMTSSLFAADEWLNKPFEFGDLDAKIRSTLARYAKAAPEKPAAKAKAPAKAKAAAKSKPKAKAAAKSKPKAKAVAKSKPKAKAVAKSKPKAKAVAKKPAKPRAKKKPARRRAK